MDELYVLEPDEKAPADKESGYKSLFAGLKHFYDTWRVEAKEAEFTGRYFASAQRYITLGDELSEIPRAGLEPLRREIARLAHIKLLEELQKKLREERKQEDFAKLLRQRIVERHLVKLLEEQAPEYAKTSNAVDGESRDFNKELDHVRKRLKKLGTHIRDSKLVDKATVKARVALKNSTVEEIAKLVSEQQLAARVEKKFEKMPGKAKLVRLAGKEELAKLLTKTEIVDLVIPPEPTPEEIQEVTERFTKHALPGHGKLEHDEEESRKVTQKLAVLASLMKPISHVNSTGGESLEQPAVNEKPDEKSTGVAAATESANVDRYKTALLRLEDLKEEEIAKLAGVQLAKRALANFNVKQLAGVAIEYSKYEYFGDWVEGEHATFAELEKDVQHMSLEGVTERAFPDEPAEAEGAHHSSQEVIFPPTIL